MHNPDLMRQIREAAPIEAAVFREAVIPGAIPSNPAAAGDNLLAKLAEYTGLGTLKRGLDDFQEGM